MPHRSTIQMSILRAESWRKWRKHGSTHGNSGEDAIGVIPSSLTRATVKARVLDDPNHDDDEDFLKVLNVSEGDGPIDTLVNTLKEALAPSHPELLNLQLIVCKVHILDPESATRAETRIMIEFEDIESHRKWTTVSVDRNIISASQNVLVNRLSML